MIVIGLTGGIASGKSTVSSILRNLGAEIIDADIIGREIVKPGSPAWNAIRREFGDGVLRPDGNIDRPRLGALVFSDPAALRRLNDLTHPEILNVVQRRISEAAERRSSPPAVVVDAAVLLEAGMDSLVDAVWIVKVDPNTQVERLIARDRFSTEGARQRIGAQAAGRRTSIRPVIMIDNAGSVQDLERLVRDLWASTTKDLAGKSGKSPQ